MKQLTLLALILFSSIMTNAQIPDFSQYPVYRGKDLGLTYSPLQSVFKIWSPPAEAAELKLYREGTGGEALAVYPLQKGSNGTWTATVTGDQKGKFYAFRVKINGQWKEEVTDPYAKAVGVNGKRAMVIDLKETNPVGWDKDLARVKQIQQPVLQSVIYELHVRDASIHPSSGIVHKGKFLGLTELNTQSPQAQATGLSHLKEMGVTHVHLLPSYDFYTVNETKLDSPQYNWGYDPLNYNTPEGSYSTNPYDGRVRIREFKQLVQRFHEQGLKVVMDVVYNHTMFNEESNFNQLVPGYYYRQDKNGKFSNATACNNETASERPMMRKFILESVLYWVKEYHIDGFRFDLMGVHDIETMNEISKALRAINPNILLYGEGWTAGASPLPDSVRALKKNAHKLHHIAVFSDDIRDGIKGSVFDEKDRGFASGKTAMEESIKFGIVASCRHPQVDYSKVNYSKAPYATEPHQVITYCECHDNHVLWDKLAISNPDQPESVRKEMHKLALTIVLTSQGIPFLHAGTEMLRSKNGNENSYNAGDAVNAIDWSLKEKNKDITDYVKYLVSIRKQHPAFRLPNAKMIANHIQFLSNQPEGTLVYTINGAAAGDSWKKIYVVFNGNATAARLTLPKGSWGMAIYNNSRYLLKKLQSGTLEVAPYSAAVLYQ